MLLRNGGPKVLRTHTNVSHFEHGRAVRDDGDEVPFRRVAIDVGRVLVDLHAGKRAMPGV
jgi:hypothetical protein